MDAFRRSIAVVVGIDRYGSGIPPLGSARRDADRIGTLLREGHGYEVRSFLDEEATGEQLLRALTRDLAPDVGPEDRVLFYFAGHGVALDGDGGVNGYLLPADAQRGVETSYLHMPRVHDALVALGCRHLLVILDCCFAGAFRWSGTRDLIVLPEVIHQERLDRFVKSAAWQVITSAASDQRALDQLPAGPLGSRGDGAHSPFALALFEALAGAGDVVPAGGGDGVITATELYVYLEHRLQSRSEGAGADQTPRLWPLRKHDKGEFIFLVPGRDVDLPPAPPLDYAANPYVGLRSFEASEADLFFGRTEVVHELFDHVATRPLSVVLGASGTGKSSVVKAGLLPFITAHDDRATVAPIVRPGPEPLESLRRALVSVAPPPDVSASSDAAVESGVAAWCHGNPGRRLVLVVDQLEELVTLARDEQAREPVVALLERLVESHPDQLRVIATLRSDFEPVLRDLAWSQRWADARYLLRPMTQDELREVIEAPASRRVLYFEPSSLVDELINEVVATPGGLPLLSFALSEMYMHFVNRRSSDRAITEEDYHAVGGVIGALRARADREYEALDPARRETMRRVMLRMVALGSGGGARRRVWRSELVYDDEVENARVAHVLERLSSARLIVLGHDDGGEPWAEPAHDALVAAWNRLIGWVRAANEDPVADLRFQRALAQSARDWSGEADAKVRDGLLWKDAVRGGILGRLASVATAGLNRQEHAFARRSIRLRRRARAVLVATLVVIVMLAGAAIVAAVRASANARQARDEASAARGALLGRMAVTAEAETPVETEGIRLLLAAEAVRLAASTGAVHRVPDAENVIRRAAATMSGIRLTGYLEPIPRMVATASWSHFTADGRWLLTGNVLADWAHVWDLHAPRPSEAHARIDGLVSWTPFAPLVVSAGSWLVAVIGTADSVRVEVRDTRRPDWAAAAPVLAVPFSDDGVLIASRDGRRVAGASATDAWLIDLQGPEPTQRMLDGSIGPVAFSENGDWLVTGATGSGIRIHDLREADAPPRAVAGVDAPVASSADASWIVAMADGTAHIVHAPTGHIAGEVPRLDPEEPSQYLTFSPTGDWLIFRHQDGAHSLWRLDPETGRADVVETGSWATLDASGTRITSAPSADRIVVREDTGTARTVPGARPPLRVGGRLLAARDDHGAIAIWDLDDPRSGPFTVAEGEAEPIAWAGSGTLLVTRSRVEREDGEALEGWVHRFWMIDAEARSATLAWEQGTDPDAENHATVSPDGRWWLDAEIASALLLDLDALGDARPMNDLAPISAHGWAADADLLVTGHADGTIRAWSTAAAPAPVALAEGQGEVVWLDVTADGHWLLTQHPGQFLLWARDSTGYTLAGDAGVLDLDRSALGESRRAELLLDMDQADYAPGAWRPPIGLGTGGSTVEAVLADGRVASWAIDSIIRATREGRAPRSVAAVVAPPADRRWSLTRAGDSVEVRDARRPRADPLRVYAGSAVVSDDERWLLSGCSGFTPDSRWVYNSEPLFWPVDPVRRAEAAWSAPDAGYTPGSWACNLHPLTGRSQRPDTLFFASALSLPEAAGGSFPTGLRFSADGRWVVVRWSYRQFADCGYTSDLRIMDLHAANPLETLVPIELTGEGCPPIEFAPDGRWVAAGAVLRDLAPHADMAQSFWLPSPVLTFDPRGRFVVTASETTWTSGTAPAPSEYVSLRFVPLLPDALIDTACILAGRNPSREEWRRYFPGEAYRSICPRLPKP